MAATFVDTLTTWAPDTRHYLTDNGEHVAVTVDAGLNDVTAAGVNAILAANGVPTLDSGVHKIIVSPTVILPCTPEGYAIDLTPLHTFPPGTTHEQALTEAGY